MTLWLHHQSSISVRRPFRNFPASVLSLSLLTCSLFHSSFTPLPLSLSHYSSAVSSHLTFPSTLLLHSPTPPLCPVILPPPLVSLIFISLSLSSRSSVILTPLSVWTFSSLLTDLISDWCDRVFPSVLNPLLSHQLPLYFCIFLHFRTLFSSPTCSTLSLTHWTKQSLIQTTHT